MIVSKMMAVDAAQVWPVKLPPHRESVKSVRMPPPPRRVTTSRQVASTASRSQKTHPKVGSNSFQPRTDSPTCLRAITHGAPCATRSHSDAGQQPPGQSEALKRLARRVRSFPEGAFTPSPSPALLDEITDELLVIASDAVSAVGKEAPALTGNSIFRLLAWTVADARGAKAVLDKPLALTVGKRLDRQAVNVRRQISEINGRCMGACDRLRNDAEGDASRTELLPRQLEAAENEKWLSLKLISMEVYVGFTELEPLLVSESEPEPEPEPEPTPATDAQQPNTGKAQYEVPTGPFTHFPWYLDDTPMTNCPVPADLEAALGPDGTAALEERQADRGFEHSADWWSRGLPTFARSLMRELALAKRLHTEEEARHDATAQQAAKDKAKDAGDLAAAYDEIEELHTELAKVKGQRQALQCGSFMAT
jgi:hypothetical protein